MSVQPRPTDNLTVDFLQLGMPYIEFAPSLGSGAFGPFRSLGIVDSAEVAKTLELVTLRSAQSGISVKIRELVRQFDAALNVGLFQHSPENMQLMFGSSTLTDVVSNPAESVVGDPFLLTDDSDDFLDLANQLIDESTVVITADLITDEDVGTGDGTTGDTSGDFALDFKVLLVADVTSLTVAGVAFTPIATGAAAAGNEVEVEIGATAVAGDLQFFVGGVAANVTGQILATYEPSFATALNTDFTTDPRPGRVRILLLDGPGDAFKSFQPLEADYDFEEIAHDDLKPFTQFVFAGQTRVRLLTDVGINIIWTIPDTSVRVTDDAFTFNRDEFQVTQLVIDLFDAGGSVRFGTLELYPETP
jgi:hypothetical protein